KVLGGRGGAHGKRSVFAVLGDQCLVGFRYLGAQPLGEGGRHDPFADLAAGRGQLADVIDIQRGQRLVDPVGQALMPEEVAVGLRGGREAAGNLDAGAGEVGDHFAKRSVLATDAFDVIHAKRFEPDNVLV